MLLILNVSDIETSHIIYCDPIKNTVIENSKFIRLIYSSSYFSLNGIFIKTNFQNYTIDKNFNKTRCFINVDDNKGIINKLIKIEREILSTYNTNKRKILKLSEYLQRGVLKIFNEKFTPSNLIFKISGIWENHDECGLTYKFFTI